MHCLAFNIIFIGGRGQIPRGGGPPGKPRGGKIPSAPPCVRRCKFQHSSGGVINIHECSFQRIPPVD